MPLPFGSRRFRAFLLHFTSLPRGLTIVYSATVVKDLGPRVRVRDDSGQVTVARSKDTVADGGNMYTRFPEVLAEPLRGPRRQGELRHANYK
jgi:hypothetical protein